MIGLFLQAAHVNRIAAIVLSIWQILSPPSARTSDAAELATAIALAVDGDTSPVWGDAELEAAVAAVFCWHESRVRIHPVQWRDPKTGILTDSHAHGAFQLRSEAGNGDALTQAVAWIDLLKLGAEKCPDSPAAPLSGSCLLAKRLADRRVETAVRLLKAVTQ